MFLILSPFGKVSRSISWKRMNFDQDVAVKLVPVNSLAPGRFEGHVR